MPAQTTIIFPHIPKCGGTSIRRQLEATSLRTFFDYDAPPHFKQWHARQCQRRNIEFSHLDFSPFDIVFGHFPANRYRKPDYRHVTLLRHPVDRALSHFFYWRDQLKENTGAIDRDPLILDIKAGTVGFIEFLRKQRIGNFYQRYIADFKPADFIHVGFTDDYTAFATQLSELVGTNIDAGVVMRQGQKEPLDSKTATQAERILKEEITLFREFETYWRGK